MKTHGEEPANPLAEVDEEKLREVVKRGLSKIDRREQMVSAVMSGLKDRYPATAEELVEKRKQVRKQLAESNGW